MGKIRTFIKNLRVQSPRTDPFSLGVSIVLVVLGLCAAAGLLVFYYFSAGFEQICNYSPSLSYNDTECSSASLLFASSYYTRPNLATENTAQVAGQSLTSIGIFPWLMGGFGNGSPNTPIDYSQQSLNYSSTTFQCSPFFTFVTLRTDSASSTTQTCWYCGDTLRVTCSLVDSERTQSTLGSLKGFATMSANYAQIFNYIAANTSAILGGASGSIMSVTLKSYTAVPNLPSGILEAPFDETSLDMAIGTSSGAFPLTTTSTNNNVRALAVALQSAGAYAQALAGSDLNGRRFLVNYSCKKCQEERKKWRPLLAALGAGLGQWPIFWTIAIMLFAFIYNPNGVPQQQPAFTAPSPSSVSGSPTTNKPYWTPQPPVSSLAYQPAPQQFQQQQYQQQSYFAHTP